MAGYFCAECDPSIALHCEIGGAQLAYHRLAKPTQRHISLNVPYARMPRLSHQRVSLLLEQGACIGLFPEGTTTDGKQVGHFHSALIQPAIDAGIKLCPIALRYQDKDGEAGNRRSFHRRHVADAIHLANSALLTPQCIACIHPRADG